MSPTVTRSRTPRHTIDPAEQHLVDVGLVRVVLVMQTARRLIEDLLEQPGTSLQDKREGFPGVLDQNLISLAMNMGRDLILLRAHLTRAGQRLLEQARQGNA
jgi:hypothetical protein